MTDDGALQKRAPETNAPEESTNELPRIRTYAADMSRVIKARGETLASIVNKERTASLENQEAPADKPHSYRKLLIGVGIGVFILAGALTLIGALFFTPKDAATVERQGIIFANKTVTVAPSSDEPFIEQLARVRNESNFSLGEILRVVPTENDATIPAGIVAARLGLPDALQREVVDIMVGVHSFDRNQPFIILRLATYDRSFAALLAWEKTMGQTLGDFFAPLGRSGANAPTLTFTDTILENLDVRQTEGSWPMLYTFPEQRLVIITTNEFTLREIITRLGAARRAF